MRERVGLGVGVCWVSVYLAEAHIMAHVCSAALMVLPPGVLEKERTWVMDMLL